jgi:hypothetical protein
MRRVESKQKQIAKQPLGMRERGAIRVVNKSEAAFMHSLFELRGDFAQSRRVDLIKSPASGAQFVKRAQKTIRISSDGFRNEHCFITGAFAGEFFGSDGENEPKMLAQRHVQATAAKH